MEKEKIDFFVNLNRKYFTSYQLELIREDLAAFPDEKAVQVMSTSTSFKDPATMLVISIFFGNHGVDRFVLGEVGLGILKLLTCGGAGIWTIVDWFTIKKKTYKYNFERFCELLLY